MSLGFIAVLSLLLLPLLWAVDGVWLAVPVAEGLAFLVSAVLLARYPKMIYPPEEK